MKPTFIQHLRLLMTHKGRQVLKDIKAFNKQCKQDEAILNKYRSILGA